MAKTPIERFEASIQKILNDYENEVVTGVKVAAQKVAEAGKRAVKSSSRSSFGGTGKYAKGWKVTREGDRIDVRYYIHNATMPFLPHLLEWGHAKQNGGRVPGRAHIKPVEEQIIKDFEAQIKRNI